MNSMMKAAKHAATVRTKENQRVHGYEGPFKKNHYNKYDAGVPKNKKQEKERRVRQSSASQG